MPEDGGIPSALYGDSTIHELLTSVASTARDLRRGERASATSRRLEESKMRWPHFREQGQSMRVARLRAHAALLVWATALLMATSFFAR
jgi:hypothetical protein